MLNLIDEQNYFQKRWDSHKKFLAEKVRIAFHNRLKDNKRNLNYCYPKGKSHSFKPFWSCRLCLHFFTLQRMETSDITNVLIDAIKWYLNTTIPLKRLYLLCIYMYMLGKLAKTTEWLRIKSSVLSEMVTDASRHEKNYHLSLGYPSDHVNYHCATVNVHQTGCNSKQYHGFRVK